MLTFNKLNYKSKISILENRFLQISDIKKLFNLKLILN